MSVDPMKRMRHAVESVKQISKTFYKVRPVNPPD